MWEMRNIRGILARILGGKRNFATLALFEREISKWMLDLVWTEH
jgi:hypothetical protein